MSLGNDEAQTTFLIGHHEPQRDYPVTDEVLHYVQQDCNYDMLTAPITTDKFNERVISAIVPHLEGRVNETSLYNNVSSLSNYHHPSPSLESLNYPEDTSLEPLGSTSQLVFTSSSWIDLASPDPVVADISNQVLQLEIQYAAFCGAANVVVYGPRMHQGQCSPEGISQYARAIQAALRSGPYVQISLLLDISCQKEASMLSHKGDLVQYARDSYNWKLESGENLSQEEYQIWEVWNTIRTICKYNGRLSVALTIPSTLPSLSLQSRWRSEPLRILHIPSSSFEYNSHGSAFLSQSHHRLLEKYMCLRQTPSILLSGVGPLPGLKELDISLPMTGVQAFEMDPTPAETAAMSNSPPNNNLVMTPLDYMRLLQSKLPPKSPLERFGAGYQDYLQNPLQPLSDNLESITYEVFEKDPVKYDWYERAMTFALSDWMTHSKPASGPGGRVVVAVVGAGRGPLVARAIRASAKSGVELDLWALEKNPNAFVLLQKFNREQWNSQVHLVQADMRTWAGPPLPSQHIRPSGSDPRNHQFIDIFVSELLGSFADNELSPECLDGVQHLLNPSHGLSIPSSYSSYLTPIGAPKLHADIMARTASGDPNAGETPCVVFLHAVDLLSTRPPSKLPHGAEGWHPQRFRSDPIPVVHLAWEFSHPSEAFDASKGPPPSDNTHNRRFRKLDFHCRDRGVCHGLAGYFETVLYDPTLQSGEEQSNSAKVELSTNPLTMDLKSKDMISWFPIYFPLKTPLYFPDNTLLSVSIWRQTDGRKVWYEWMVESFMLLDTGKDGQHRVERLGATDLHSSIASGCLL